jgi:stalled ribosome rescue protein Dom34
VLVADQFPLLAPIVDLLEADDLDVLVLSIGGGDTDGAQHFRLSEGALTEEVGDGLPAEWDVRDAGERYLEEPKDSDWRDARIDDFLRQVDRVLIERFGQAHDRHLVVVGTERLRTHWYSVADPANLRAVVAQVDGNFDRARPSVLRDRVIETVRGVRSSLALAAVDELRGMDPARTAVGIDDVVTLARAGRLHRLLVEGAATAEVEVDGVVIGDRIANAVRAAFDAGTEILIVPKGSLAVEEGVAGVVRW